jgi:hypothetical protein
MDKILAKDLAFVPQRVDKKLGSGFNALASSGGRAVLINSCLDSIANYAMGFYLLDEGNHHRLDMSRARFFWEGVGGKRKYHMVRWEVLCKPKEVGGMGFLDTRVRNICLLSKWIFKLESESQDLSCQILRKKYMGNSGFFQSESKGSQFWKSLHKIKHWFRMATLYLIGDGRKTMFWRDVWIVDCPLKIMFPALFECCEQTESTVWEVLRFGWINLSFPRSFGPQEVEQWDRLGVMLVNVGLREDRDIVCWKLEKNNKFSTRSLYKFILDPGVKDLRAMDIWKCRIPLKQKNFLWLCFRGKIQSALELRENGQVQ